MTSFLFSMNLKINIFAIVLCSICTLLFGYQDSSSIRYSVERDQSSCPIVYYFAPPIEARNSYPILLLCDGSLQKNNARSCLYIREYFDSTIKQLNVGYLTVEHWGIDGDHIDKEEFWRHYTRSQRLKDHLQVIDFLEKNPPSGWNGQLIFIGVSEGGALVTDLSIACTNAIATINWVGAGDFSWADELWQFFEHWKQNSFWMSLYDKVPRFLPFSLDMPKKREEFDLLIEEIIANPVYDRSFAGMSYLYHADAFLKPPIDYSQIHGPLLVVKGAMDSDIESCDAFVSKAKLAGVDVTYFRIDDMDHYIRKRPDVIKASFDWLKKKIYTK